MQRAKLFVLVAVAAIAICRIAGATGILVPDQQGLPPLAIRSHRVNAQIQDGVATTKVEEVFLNSTNRRLEATFIFPIPKGAALTDFAMFIDGRRQSGQIVKAEKARRIYEDIVRRMRDPGLLEYLDSNLLKMRVFPILPNKPVKVEVSYTNQIPFDSGVYDYTFPLKTGNKASKVLEDFTLTVDIHSKQPIKSVYCPSHDVGVSRKSDHHAVVGFEQEGARLDKDFRLFYTVSKGDFGLNLLTHRLEGQDGFFALMISPRVELSQKKVMAKDVCFVIDTSGSMQEENRIQSAREAVKFCLKALNPADRFALITFSSAVDVHGEGLRKATKEAVEEAVQTVDGLEARGGTDLCGATLEALRMAPKGERPYLIVLVTDGKPTVGIKTPDKIIAKVEETNQSNTRVFTFGIAQNLNVPLLDRIAETTRGYSEYVAPGRQIEEKISSFFRKVSYPVMANLKLRYGDVEVRDVYPPHLPDLFRGSQVVAFGRYSGAGDTALRLSGTIQGQNKRFIYDATFPKKEADNAFLPQLWARRKIGYLLDQIRLHGESKELTDEVVRLSKEYGIATPYTSYLVLENEEAYRRHGILSNGVQQRLRGLSVPVESRGEMARPVAEARDRADALKREYRMLAPSSAPARVGGGEAVAFSRKLKDWKAAEVVSEGAQQATVHRVGEKTFARLGQSYVDTAFTQKMETLKIKWGSDAYFNLLDALPHLTHYLALGENVVVVIGQKALVVTAEEGKERMTPDQIKEFFKTKGE
ncbi:MAG: VWA domain-containing protein [Planctomycetes bacterium]|nr:VWA domain-containing protein [Planctomycetota bacterium]